MGLLSAFIDYTFQITDFFWLEHAISPETSVHQVVSQSNIISTDQLGQMMLIMPAGMVLRLKAICLHGEFGAIHVSHITSHLQNPGRLLVGRCVGRTRSGTDEQPEIICVHTGVPEEYNYRRWAHDPIALRTGPVIFSLSPTQKVYAAQRQDTLPNTDDEIDPMDALQDVQLGIAEIKDGVNLLDVEIGSSTLGRMIGAFEIWEIQDMEDSDSGME